jgi:hypothetical protein
MYTPTTHWDRPPTDKELNSFYGKDKDNTVRDNMIEALTVTIRTVPIEQIGLQYVTYQGTFGSGTSKLGAYPVAEVVTDYGTDKGPLQALLAVLAGSDCPLVAKYREALAQRYADSNADSVEDFLA